MDDLSAAHFTVPQLAARCRVHPMTVRRWIRSGRLRALRLGRRCVRIPAAAVARFEKARPA